MSNFVTVSSTTKLYTLNCTGTSFVFTFITKTSGGKGRSAITTNLAGVYFFCNDALASFQIGINTNNSGFNINCEGLVLHTTSIYFRSATAVYFAPDHTTSVQMNFLTSALWIALPHLKCTKKIVSKHLFS